MSGRRDHRRAETDAHRAYCGLRLAPCPVDCIAMVPAVGADANWNHVRADAARERYERRSVRLARNKAVRGKRAVQPSVVPLASPEVKRAAIAAALERARARRNRGLGR